MEQRRPARSYNPRRPARSYWTRRPARSCNQGSPARSYCTRRPGRSYNPRKPARSYIPRRPERSYCTIGIGLKACSGVEAAEKGEQTRAHLVKVGLEGEVLITSAVVNMHANWGNRKDTRNLFEKMPECIEVPWKSHMDVGFVCLRKGEVKRMNVHLLALSRVCSISAASEQVVWPTLPGVCRILGNLEFGVLIAQHIFELDPQDDISDGMLSSNYVGGGILDKAAEGRKLANDGSARREAGRSWIKANDKSYLFMVENLSISQISTKKIEEAGYMPDTNYILDIVEMHKKECYLTYHSKN